MKVKIKINKSILCLLVIGLVFLEVTFSQQDPQYTQYRYNMSVVNPAYAGSREAISINALAKRQWVGVEGGPKTAALSINSPLNRLRGLGLGFTAIYDDVTPLKETHIYADVSYKLNVSFDGELSLGLKGGFSFQNVDESILNFKEDQALANGAINRTYANFGFGLYYKLENFYTGLSIPNILQNSFLQSGINAVSERQRSNTLYLTSGYVHEVNENLHLKPSFLIKYSTVFPLSLDVSFTAFINNQFELGSSYRFKESIGFIAAFFVNENFRIGYAYDYTLGDIGVFSQGSHEIILLFDLPVESRTKKHRKHRVKYF